MIVLGYTIPELQEFINFAKEKDVYKLISKIAILQNEILAVDREDKCYNNGEEVDSDCVHDWMCSKCGNWKTPAVPETHE
jgi:hypothetical protein